MRKLVERRLGSFELNKKAFHRREWETATGVLKALLHDNPPEPDRIVKLLLGRQYLLSGAQIEYYIPDCDNSRIFMELTGKPRFSKLDIENIERLGYVILTRETE